MQFRVASIALALTNIGLAVAGLEACSSSDSDSEPPCRAERGCLTACPAARQAQVSAEIACEVATSSEGGCEKACGSPQQGCSVEPSFVDEMKSAADASFPDAGSSDAASDGAAADASTVSAACPKRAASVTCTPFCYGGRGTNGIDMRAPRGSSEGAHFAQMAELEAISVFAFRRMASELEHLGAPAVLVASARSAAGEESDHAAAMSSLALARGAGLFVPMPDGAFEPRSLFELACENAREGCVRESYGAVLAAFAAVRAEDPAVREVMTRVANEEARHAQLSWDLHAWSSSLLTEAEQATVREEIVRARESLRDSLCDHQDWGKRVGLPSLTESLRLLDATESLLFAA
jgi:hypothetical protein